jgi:branched-chain amino acid transport system substrate-binding protein
MRTKKLFFSGVVVLVLAIVLVTGGLFGCAESPKVDEWHFPQISILSGFGASFGLEAAWGAERAVNEINEAGGINGIPIRLTLYDTALDNAKAVTVMTEVLGTNPLVIIGPMDQGAIEVSGDLAVEEGVPFISSLASPSLRELFSPWGCSLYHDNDFMFQAGIKAWLELNPDIKSVVWFYCPDAASHVEATEYAEEEFERLGIELLDKVECTFGQLDFGPAAIRAMDLNPDGYCSVLNADEMSKLVIELHNRGIIEGRRICASLAASSSIYYELAEGYLEDTYIYDPYAMDFDSASWQDYVQDFQDDHDGGLPYSMAVQGHYDAVYAIKAAIESLGITGDPEKLADERIAIRDFLWNAENLHGCQEEYNYVEGQKSGVLYLFQIHDNVPVVVATISQE